MDLIEKIKNISEEKFRFCCNKLLNECFLLKKHSDTQAAYNFVMINRDVFSEYFSFLGYELIFKEDSGYIALWNVYGNGRLNLKKTESILLLILRLLYAEKRKMLSMTKDVVVLIEEVYDKYNYLKPNGLPGKVEMRKSFALFKRYNLVQCLDSDVAKSDTRVIIYPSIMFAVSADNIDEVYNMTQNKLLNYFKGGANESTDNEFEEDLD